MARLRLTLHKVECYQKADGISAKECLQISTEKETDSAFFLKSEGQYVNYTLNLVDFSFKKKMYQPTEIIAAIQLTMATGATWTSLNRSTLDSLFKFKKVSLEELSPTLTDNTVVQTIGDDFYVHEVLVNLKPDAMYVTLKIYSLDKLMTLQQTSRTFVAQKLGDDILKTEATKYIKPWTIDEQIPVLKKQIAEKNIRIAKLTVDSLSKPSNKQISAELHTLTEEVKKQENDVKDKEAAQKPVTYSIDNMQTLKYGDNKTEHIFPYLVQYNESFYDMLARTTNRWGEFMYYENNQLNIGYAYDEKNVTEIKDNYGTITYVDLEAKKALIAKDGNLDYAGADEKDILDNTLRKSPNTISGTLFWPTTKKWDKVLMKEITSFLKNDKNVPTWLGNRLFDNTWDLAVKAANMKKGNDEFDDKWFPEKDEDKPCKTEHYGDYNFGSEKEPDNDKGVNLFSEVNSKYKSSKYADILAKEQSSGRNAVCIDFLTNCPKLKLGDVIKVSGELFIVVEISSKTEVKDLYGIADNDMKKAVEEKKGTVVTKTTTTALTFHVVATAQNSDDKKFYPAVIPAGHVRQSGPQVATITDAGDPSGKNRVRVLFPWQDTKDASSPWLTFTTSGAGSPVIGKHYENDKVLIGFVDGNVERPYVLGGLSSKGSEADYVQTTPGGHQFTLPDDPNGIKNFLTGMFLPCVDTFGPFLTAIPAVKKITDAMCKPAQKDKNNLAMGGGFELSDNYGIYKISGSTDGREISIASPWGDVNINAFTGITISAPNGDIEIKGKNIKLEAGNNLEIISGTNIKNKILGEGGKSGFFEDVGVAVAKKLAAKALNVVDLSIIRSVMEIIFRPAEGQLRIKSNRFLMLDAGKGDCVYPENAYVKKEDYEEYLKEQDKNNSRNGLRLSTNILEMLSRINTLGDLMDSRYITSYNNCRQKYLAFNDSISKAQRYAKDYSPTNQHPKICNEYSEDALKNSMWADPATAPNFDKTKLGFVDAQYSTTDKASVGNAVIQRIKRKYPINAAPADDKIKEAVLGVRVKKIEQVVNAANELRQSIIDFLKFTELDPKKDIKATASAFRDRKMPKNFMEALLKAFQKSELGDTYYFLSIDDDKRKGLKAFATDLTRDIMAPHRQILKRKAGILLLEGMGFKDEWRKKKVVAAAPTTAQVMPVGGAAAVTVPLAPPIAPAAPPAPDLEVKREFDSEKLTQAYWTDYVNSIVTIPELKPDEWKLTKELGKMVDATKDNLKSIIIPDIANENKAWSENKKGTILFSTGAKMFNLDKEIKELPAPPKGNLTEADSINDDVKGLLGDIREKLNGFN